MDFIPAIDLKDGACVRLRQGRMTDVTEFSNDPVAMAVRWADEGARRLHIVDLNGAFEGKPMHTRVIADMIAAVPEMEVQIGGGLRELAAIERYLELGAKYLVLGTRAIREPDFLASCAEQFPQSILYGLDASNGKIALAGWAETSDISAPDLIRAAGKLPLAGVVYTDIQKDGMLSGINTKAVLALAKTSHVPVIASGGASNLQDLKRLLAAQKKSGVKLGGVISGRALYEGTLDCREAVSICQT